MVKKLLTFLTLLTLFFGVGWAEDQIVTINYNSIFNPALPTSGGNSEVTTHTVEGLSIGEKYIYKGTGSNSNYLMFVQNKGYLYNTSSLGFIKSVAVTYSSGTSTSAKTGVYFGATVQATYTTTNNQTIAGQSKTDTWTNTNSGNGYFQLSSSNKNAQITKIVITYDPDIAPVTTYNVTCNSAANGTITADPTTTAAGNLVTINASPSNGYQLKSVTVSPVTSGVAAPEVTINGNTATFTMPESDVTVDATFELIPTVTYERVTSLAASDVGKKFLLVYETTPAVNGAISNASTPYAYSVTNGISLSGTTLTVQSNEAKPLTLGGESKAWTFDMGNGNYLAWTSGNSLTSKTTIDNTSRWDITFFDEKANISNFGTTTRIIRYNISDPRFACYTTNTGTLPCLYREVEATGDLTVTCADNLENGSITASPSSANAGATITINATPAAGYKLNTVTVTPESGTAPEVAIDGNSATFTMPASKVTVTATFTKAWNTIATSILPTNCGGDIWVYSGTEMDGVKKAQIGDDIYFRVVTDQYNSYQLESLTITDADNNTISYEDDPSDSGWKWQDGRYGAKFKFVMPGTAVTIKATYKRGDLYILGTVNETSAWHYTDGPKLNYDGTKYSIDVYFKGANENDKFGYFSFTTKGDASSWDDLYGKRIGSKDGDQTVINADYPIKDLEWNANAFKIPAGIYTIEVAADFSKVTITPKTVTVTLDKAAGQLEAGTTVNVVSNLTSLLQACKSGITGTLAYSTNDGTSYTEGNSFTVNSDMTAKGKAYYGYIEAESDSYAYTVVTHYAVTATANPAKGGTVSVSPTSALAGETVTVTANPKSGYELTSITVNGDEIDITNTPYTFEMPAQAANVVATFTAKTLNLTINNENSKGTVYGVPATSTVGSEISFTVTPKEGYTVNTVTYSFTPTGGTENTTTLTAPYSFNMPGYDVTINITYTEQSSGGGDETDLYHESFGSNPNSVRDWDDSYSVKTGVEDVYSGITGYTVENVGQSKNTVGYIESGLAQRSQSSDASIIIGPLNVANYTDLELSYYWKAASVGATYYTNLYYATSADGTYTEVEGTGNGATTFVKRTYNLPEAAQVSTLYLKIVFKTSNSSAVIDEVNLSGVPNGVAAPVFTPAQGIYGIDVDVTISCPTSGATIYYTDDESDPKTSTTRKEYTGEIVVSQTTTFKAYAEKDGLSSDVVTAIYTINKNTEIETVTPDYFESFTGSDGIGKFTINNESGYSPVWSLDGNYGVKGTAYNPNTTPTNNAAVSRLVSPIIDLTNANVPELSFSHQINSYFTDPSTQCTVWIRETTDGVNGTWVQLPVTVTVPASGSWSNDFADIDLSDYVDKKIQISFLYSNPTEGSGAGTWEIQNFVVADNSDITIVKNIAEFLALENGTKAKFKNPVTVLYDYAQYSSGSYHEYIWVKDNSGYMQFYLIPTLNSSTESNLDAKAAYYENGDIIPAGFVVSKNYYENGKFVQAYSTDALNAGFEPATKKGLADPDHYEFSTLNALTLSDADIAANCNRYISIEKIKIASKSGKNFTFANETGTVNACVGYNKYNGDGSLLKDGENSADVTVPAVSNTYYNVKGIIQIWQGGWEFMPVEFTEWKANEVTLRELCQNGVENNQYTISNRLQCVYIQGNKLWVKDDNGQSIHKTTPASDDNNYEIGESSGNTQLNQSLYDQSNWLEVHLADGSANAQAFHRHIIKGGAITGTFTNKTNPTMENVVLTSTALENSDEIAGIVEYAPNYYCAANFYNGIEGGNQACIGSQHHGDFFFMNPKPQEYVQIDWAQWDGTKMIIPTGEGANEHGFNGEFGVDMSLNSNPIFSPSENTAYKFEAIVRIIESTGGNTLRANKSNDYIVYPLNLSDNVVTVINNVTGKAVAGVKYYNLAGMESDRPFEGVNIIVTTYTDGSRSSAKVLK